MAPGRRSVPAFPILLCVLVLVFGQCFSNCRGRIETTPRIAETPHFSPSILISSRIDPPTYLVVILMENKNYTDIIGNPSSPYANHLANDFGLATNYFDASNNYRLPNYLAIIAG